MTKGFTLNVAQGYTVFKKLKELRNERKEIVLELEKVQAITGHFDCDAMRKKYEEIESCLLLDFEDTTPATGDDQPVPAAV